MLQRSNYLFGPSCKHRREHDLAKNNGVSLMLLSCDCHLIVTGEKLFAKGYLLPASDSSKRNLFSFRLTPGLNHAGHCSEMRMAKNRLSDEILRAGIMGCADYF
jgi:hypothetical protein